MHKSIVLSNIDDICTEIYIDNVLGIKSHKMVIKMEGDHKDRPVYQRIRSIHKTMYEAAVGNKSKVKFVLCNYLPHNKVYEQVMVVSKCYIKKNTVLYDVGGHHFPFSKELIVAGTLHCL